jgi:hypothetical protein
MTDKNNNKEPYSETFFIIPAYILDLPGMTLGYLKVYGTFFQFWNKRLPCFLSNPAIMERTNLRKSQVSDALTYFENNGELIREQRGNKRYLLKPEKPIEWSDNTQPPAPAVPSTTNAQPPATAGGGTRYSGMQPPATAGTEYKEENIKNLSEREGESSTPQNTELVIIRKSNPLASFLPDKYLLMQKQLTIQCLSDEKAYALFESKFGKLEVTFEEMLYECVMYYALKPEAQNVSNQRFIAWIKRERVEIYDKKPDSVAHKLYRDLTEQEKSLVSDYMHFKKYPDLQHRMTDIQKKQAQDLLDLLKSTQNMRAI